MTSSPTPEGRFLRVVTTGLPGFLIIEPRVFRDGRGFFQETYRANVLAQSGISHDWVQDNHSRSVRGVLRGLHFSLGEGQAKLIRCARGAIWDVAVDLRRGSPTYGQWDGVKLDDEDARMAYIPVGFAHGFVTLSDVADVVYKCSNYYDGELERGIAYNDPDIGVEWPGGESAIVSDRDADAPRLRDVADDLPFVFDPASPTSSP